jgi:hypothetical protein
MAEEWLERLAHQIKENERRSAEEAARSRRRVELLGQKGPVFWKAFADALQENVAVLKNLLEGDVTLTEGPLSFSFDPSSLQITIGKTAFPRIRFTATPRFDREVAEIEYLQAGSKSEAVSMNCHFNVGIDGRVTMRLEGRPFVNPTDAATFVIERLFRFPSFRRAESDSHLGRVGSE